MSDLPPPPEPPPPPPPPPGGGPLPPPPGYVAYGQHQPVGHGTYAGFWRRFAAAIIDALIVGVPMAVLGAMAGAFDTTTIDQFGNETERTDFRIWFGWNTAAPAWWNLLNNVVGATYWGLLEGGRTGQTIGKMALGIRVVDANTGQAGIGVGRGIGRYFARILSAIPLALGYLWMLWDDRKQTWHDKLVSSVVVKG